jgi:hypothetical protein
VNCFQENCNSQSELHTRKGPIWTKTEFAGTTFTKCNSNAFSSFRNETYWQINGLCRVHLVQRSNYLFAKQLSVWWRDDRTQTRDSLFLPPSLPHFCKGVLTPISLQHWGFNTQTALWSVGHRVLCPSFWSGAGSEWMYIKQISSLSAYFRTSNCEWI